MNYQEINAKTVDGWVEGGWTWGKPIDHETYAQAVKGDWQLLLTPTRPMPKAWLFDQMQGKKVLGLASGGGQQMPLFAAMGAEVTVFDYSQKQVDSDKMVAKREHYPLTAIRGDMTKPLPFADNSFDLICQPVANCYIEDVLTLWQRCYKALKPGGRLICGLDNGFNYVVDDSETKIVHSLPYNPLKDPILMASLDLKEDGVQFSHTFDEQIRGQLQAGFQLLDCYEDYNDAGRLVELKIPSFWATCSQKPA